MSWRLTKQGAARSTYASQKIQTITSSLTLTILKQKTTMKMKTMTHPRPVPLTPDNPRETYPKVAKGQSPLSLKQKRNTLHPTDHGLAYELRLQEGREHRSLAKAGRCHPGPFLLAVRAHLSEVYLRGLICPLLVVIYLPLQKGDHHPSGTCLHLGLSLL